MGVFLFGLYNILFEKERKYLENFMGNLEFWNEVFEVVMGLIGVSIIFFVN